MHRAGVVLAADLEVNGQMLEAQSP